MAESSIFSSRIDCQKRVSSFHQGLLNCRRVTSPLPSAPLPAPGSRLSLHDRTEKVTTTMHAAAVSLNYVSTANIHDVMKEALEAAPPVLTGDKLLKIRGVDDRLWFESFRLATTHPMHAHFSELALNGDLEPLLARVPPVGKGIPFAEFAVDGTALTFGDS